MKRISLFAVLGALILALYAVPAIADFVTCPVTGGDCNGTRNNDVIEGSEADDLIESRSGTDQVLGNTGDDIIRGDNGSDFAEGGEGDDTISGGAGDDNLNDRDEITEDRDEIRGQDGNDTIRADDGDTNDIVSCGAGADLAVVDDLSEIENRRECEQREVRPATTTTPTATQ